MGVELLKDDTYLADAEVLLLTIKNLITIGLEDFKVCVYTRETDLERLNKILNIIDKEGYSRFISVDKDLDSNFKYYTGMIFKVYTYGVGESICKGGRYNSLLGKYGEEAPAVGCVFMIDNILQSIKRQKIATDFKKNKKIYIVYSDSKEEEAIEKANELREKGEICVIVKDNLFTSNLSELCKNNDYEVFKL